MIEIKLIKILLKNECEKCKVLYTNRCNDCNFAIEGGRPYTGSKFKYAGINKRIGKHYLFYFLNNPHLNFKLPPLPDYDLYGNYRYNYKRWEWHLHHEDGNELNDSEWNLILLLNTEHAIIHSQNAEMHKPENREKALKTRINRLITGDLKIICKDETKQKIKENHKIRFENGTHHLLFDNPMYHEEIIEKQRKIQKQKVEKGIHHLQLNPPMRNPELVKSSSIKKSRIQREKVKEGNHNLLGDNNPMRNTEKYLRLKEWLKNLDINNKICISKELALELNYGESTNLKYAIEKIIQHDTFEYYKLIHNGLKYKKSTWFIERIK